MPRQRVKNSYKGCSCKKSGCLKNYCECYEKKIPCTSSCKCLGCKNTQHIHLPKSSAEKAKIPSKESRRRSSLIKTETAGAVISCLFAKAKQCEEFQMSPAAVQLELIMEFNRALGIILEKNQEN